MYAFQYSHVHLWQESTDVDCEKELDGEVLESFTRGGIRIECICELQPSP
jgi:hypothetical protein